MTLYDSLTGRAGTEECHFRDRRIFACEAMATARVAEALGDEDRALRSYERSLASWNLLQFDMRAAIVTLDLERITRDARYRISIEAVLGRAPKAWFAHREPAAIELLPAITPAEKLVLASLLEGKSARAIAQDLDRSVHTINNHTRKIFKAFGVTSRAAVLARCATLGITPTQVRRKR
jgi:DNA-binding CsgD family transcriptional regulator